MKPKQTHGGRRPGAGRPAEHGERKLWRSVGLTPCVWAFLASRDGSAGATIESIVRRSAAFKSFDRQTGAK